MHCHIVTCSGINPPCNLKDTCTESMLHSSLYTGRLTCVFEFWDIFQSVFVALALVFPQSEVMLQSICVGVCRCTLSGGAVVNIL